MAERDDFPAGSVWLVGAGPGDPELLTRKADRLLLAADTIFHDALVGPGVLDLASPRARLIDIGKRCGHHSADQATIGRMIVQAASSGQRVVRLSFFEERAHPEIAAHLALPLGTVKSRLRLALNKLRLHWEQAS